MRSDVRKSAVFALLIAFVHLILACAASSKSTSHGTEPKQNNMQALQKVSDKKAAPKKPVSKKPTVLKSVSEKPILTVTGLIKNSQSSADLTFDRAALEALGSETIVTETPWHKGAVKFEGVRLSKLLKVVEASGKTLIVSALNDYSGEIPVEDAEKFDVLLALKADGRYMSVSDKGPIFVVYPYDAYPDLNNQKYYSRAVWQVNRIEVK